MNAFDRLSQIKRSNNLLIAPTEVQLIIEKVDTHLIKSNGTQTK